MQLNFEKSLHLTFSKKHSIPANISWSWRRIQHVSSVTILRLSRRLEDVLQRSLETSCKDVLKTSWRSLEDVFKTSSRRLERQKIVTLKTSSRCFEDISWRRLEDMSWRRYDDMSCRCLEDVLKTLWRQGKFLLGISESTCISNKSIYHKSVFDNSKANPKCIN